MKTIHNPFTSLRRCRGGTFVKLLLFLVVFMSLVALAWMFFLPSVLTSVVRKRTGFDVQIKKMAVNPFNGDFSIAGLVINNPAGWPSPEFVDVREFRAETDLWSLIGGKRAIIDNAVVDVALVALVTDSEKKTNLQLFQDRIAGPKDAKKKQPDSGEKFDFLIRRLHLRFTKLQLMDYSGKKAAPSIREVNLNIDHTYTDITDAKQLLTGALPGINAIGSVMSALIPGGLGKAIGGAMQGPVDLMKGTGKKTMDIFKGVFEKLEEKPKK